MAEEDYNSSDHWNDEFHFRERKNNYEEKSGGQMLLEIGRLLLVLLGRLLVQLWKYTKKFLRFLLKWLCKGLLLLIDYSEKGFYRLRDFWNDNNTQEKLRVAKEVFIFWLKRLGYWLLKGVEYTGEGLVWLIEHLWIWSIWLGKKTVKAIIHLRPTLTKMWKGICIGADATWKWLKRVWHAICLWFHRRREAYRRFRKNKGFKGLLIDIGNGLKNSVTSYMDEEQDDGVEPDEAGEPRPEQRETEVDTDLLESSLPEKSKVRSWGKKFYDGLKHIVEA